MDINIRFSLLSEGDEDESSPVKELMLKKSVDKFSSDFFDVCLRVADMCTRASGKFFTKKTSDDDESSQYQMLSTFEKDAIVKARQRIASELKNCFYNKLTKGHEKAISNYYWDITNCFDVTATALENDFSKEELKLRVDQLCSNFYELDVDDVSSSTITELGDALDTVVKKINVYLNSPSFKSIEKSLTAQYDKFNNNNNKLSSAVSSYVVDNDFIPGENKGRIKDCAEKLFNAGVFAFLKKRLSSVEPNTFYQSISKSNKFDPYSIHFLFNILINNSIWKFATVDLISFYLKTEYDGTQRRMETSRQYKPGKLAIDIWKKDIVVMDHFINNGSAVDSLISSINSYVAAEEKSVNKFAKAPDDADLGQIAFSTRREGVPFEPNTKLEDDLYDIIRKHFGGDKTMSAEAAEKIRSYVENNYYGDVFKKPKATTLYRGMTVDRDWIQAAVEQDNIKSPGVLEKSFTFTPFRGGSPWSTSKDVAERFAGSVVGGRPYSVVLTANVENNPYRFITGPGGMYNVKGFDQHTSEKEVVGLGPIKVSKLEWKRRKSPEDGTWRLQNNK